MITKSKSIWIAILVPFLCFFAFSCDPKEEVLEDMMKETPLEKDSIFFLALGDSYTIGQGVTEVERWPNQLSVQLESQNFEVVETKIIAQTGWTTQKLIEAIANADLETYNLVSLLIGVNNQFQNQSFELFKSEFNQLLYTATSLAGTTSRVFVVSIPDYGVTPFGMSNAATIAAELDQYNAYMKTRCLDQNIPFINITEISRDLGASQGALASDNLHPSGLQYGKWVEEILPVVLELLEE